ncbi:MAG: isopenicillin N synthase family oxygenase [Proteobacteria bacterium]|nr:MAG: isopenicillin N synthase family oxygenase [Pseudomonadota bacterium]
MNYSIPVVDLNDYLSGDKERVERFVRAVGSALQEIGFFALTNHNVDTQLIHDSYAETKNLFALPTEAKLSYQIPGINGQRGYTAFGKEHAKGSKSPDLKEFWHVGQELSDGHDLLKTYPENVWPDGVEKFKKTTLSVFKNLEFAGLKILEACALFLGEEKTRIADTAVDGNSILRLIHYPPIPMDRDPNSIRAGAHEDINLITLLIDATSSGLELMDRKGNWIPVVTPRGCIIVDAGDMLQNLTNGFYKSTTHRVVNPDNSREARYSMPFFMHARGEVDLNPLPSCVAITGGKKLYPDITADAYLNQRLKEIGLA